MADEQVVTGELRLSDRGFREDIEQAMGNDVRRAIIELVTNADDSYMRLDRAGEIMIEVEHRRSKPRLLIVSDEAEGMTREDIDNKLAVQGEETSGFAAGRPVRGLLGRGGRDVVHFGPVSWRTWRDGEHHEFALEHGATATRKYRIQPLPPRHPRKSGTEVRLEITDRFSIPRHATLLEDLSRHYALRPILTSGRRSRIFLRSSGKGRSKELKYPTVDGTTVAAGEVEIVGYSGVKASYTLGESPTSLNDGKDRSYWRHSLIITSQGAAYDIFDGGKFKNEPFASYLARLYGVVEVPQIAQLIREFDKRESKGLRHDENNPIRLLRRDRDGLSREHPFVKQLNTALEALLTPHIERLDNEARAERSGRVSEENRKRFRDAGRILNEYLQEEELDTDGAGDGGVLSEKPGLFIIPSSLILEPDKPGSMTVRYRGAKNESEPTVEPKVYVEVKLQGGNSYKHEVTLKEREGYFSKAIHIRAEANGEVADVHARHRSQPAAGRVQWRQREQPAIESLQWSHKAYALSKDKARKALLFAPWSLVADDEEWELHVTPTERFQIRSKGMFQYDYGLNAGVSVVELSTAEIEGSGQITATVGKESTSAELRINQPRPGGIDIRPEENATIDRRAWFSEEVGVLYYNAKHPAVARLLGSKDDGWPGQNSVAFHAMLAELLANTIVRHGMSRNEEYSRDPDIDMLFSRFDTKVADLAFKLQHALIDSEQLSDTIKSPQ